MRLGQVETETGTGCFPVVGPIGTGASSKTCLICAVVPLATLMEPSSVWLVIV